eukprot:CAMPEP_0202894220 /NCGR_PEP_ID=MMETSP1392-20130828/3664_1 /ASSEMBLY_ACC=CAM_ASM_000868 /TAXON_ID=225041 /ORGANISM="Chlamydomonas chlamydogama, Strain SAG 11-48b" /LENGTH=125 /DNA_ID=CAMNT_0049578841 /DNA_START=274 /DNA_END=651 /DNA_ORIENTATION=-
MQPDSLSQPGVMATAAATAGAAAFKSRAPCYSPRLLRVCRAVPLDAAPAHDHARGIPVEDLVSQQAVAAPAHRVVPHQHVLGGQLHQMSTSCQVLAPRQAPHHLRVPLPVQHTRQHAGQRLTGQV